MVRSLQLGNNRVARAGRGRRIGVGDHRPKVRVGFGGPVLRYEAQVPYQSGGLRWIDATYTPYHDAGGDVEGVVVLVNDISAKKEAEATLRESEARFRQLADAMPQIVWAARPDGHLDYYNKRWYDYTARPREGGGDDGWNLTLHPDDVQKCTDAWYAVVQSGQPYELEYRFKNGATGEYRWHLGRACRCGTTRDASSAGTAHLPTSTTKRRAEERLKESERIVPCHWGVDRLWGLDRAPRTVETLTRAPRS